MKKILLNSKSSLLTLVIAITFVFITASSFATTKTWNGGTGTGKNWTTGPWLPAGTPAAGDDIVFNTAGTITFSTMPATIAFNSLTISQGTVNFVGGTPTKTYTLGGSGGTDFSIAAGATLSMGANINITLANNATASIAGTLIVTTGRTFNTNGTGVVSTVTGTITDNGTVTCTTASKLLFQSGSTLDYSQLGGTIPTATWDANSTCAITLTSPASGTGSWPAGTTQSFGNFSVTTTGTGTNGWQMGNSISCAGDFTLTNGSSRPGILANSATGRSITVAGNFTLASGTLDLSNSSGNGVVNVAGDFSNSGVINESGTSTASGIVFNGSSAQGFTSSGTMTNNVNVTINNAAGVTLSSTLSLPATLTLTSGILTLTPGNTLTIANGSAIGGSPFSAAKQIATQVNTGTGAQAFLRVDNIAVSSSYLFPVGDGTNYLPVTTALSSGTVVTDNSFSVCAFPGITADGTPNGTAFSAGQKAKVVDAVYTVNYNGTGTPNQAAANTTLTFVWPASLAGSSFATNPNALIGIAPYGPSP
ncbi:MAG: hypothetical protein JST86_21250, partial [Bacteroidetes bacterium]|nr:hypothetical protein [Bacteroidota bacterium]